MLEPLETREPPEAPPVPDLRERALRLLGLAPLVAALVTACSVAWDLVAPSTATIAVEPRCAGNVCAFDLERRGPAATIELTLGGEPPPGAVWEVCRGIECRVAVASSARGRTVLAAAGTSGGERLRVRLRGATSLDVRSARVSASWLGWGTVLARALERKTK